MEKKLKVLIASAEAVPFAKVGGLADVVGALPKALETKGVDVRIILPKYKTIDVKKHELTKISGITNRFISMDRNLERAEFFEARLPGTNVKAYFVANEKYYDRDGIYTDPKTGDGYEDNAERFIFFAKAIVEFARLGDWQPDVIHCNDYQTALIPAYLKVNYRGDKIAGSIGTVFSVHNLAYQGLFPDEVLEIAGFDRTLYYPTSEFEFWGEVNFMKIGITKADIITTVSKTYAVEISSDPEFGYGLEGVLKDRSEDLYGILNGIDYSVWNPEVDKLIPHKYNINDLAGKKANKSELLKRTHLADKKKDVPLIGIISRLVDQKGFDLLADKIDELMKLDLKIVLLGTGQKTYHDMFEKIAKKYPEKISVNLAFDNQLAHLIEAGSDMFLMPSRYEPCGLNQMYSLKYGTVPIVRATGGLADTIKDYDPVNDKGNGFVFREYSASELLDTIKRALETYHHKEVWRQLVIRGMSADHSWEKSASEYIDIYEKVAAT